MSQEAKDRHGARSLGADRRYAAGGIEAAGGIFLKKGFPQTPSQDFWL